MNFPNLTKYQSQWVAFTPDRKKIVASGKTIKAVVKKIEKEPNFKELIFHFVLPFNRTYSF